MGFIRKKKGFTLIELLVVIAIIAILAAILFPVFAKAKNAGKNAKCLSNMKQLGLSLQMYMGDNSQSFPVPNLQAATSAGDYYGMIYNGQCPMLNTTLMNYAKKYTVWGQLDKYIKNRKIWVCPGDPWGASGELRLDARFTSYEFRRYIGVGFTPWGQTMTGTKGRVIKESDYTYPSKSFVFAEQWPFHDWQIEPLEWFAKGGWAPTARINLAFADGHVRSTPVSKAFSPEGKEPGWDLWWPRIGGFSKGYLGSLRDID